jgi:DNA-binding MarR family transcriptional regulator
MTVTSHRDPPPSSGMTPAHGTDSVDPLEQLGRSFKSAMAAVRRLRGRETQRPGELSFAQYSLLFGLVDGGQKSVRELAFAADLAPASVTQMLESLAAIGLVERVRSEGDRRVVLTSLTERGSALLAERRALLQPRWRDALAEFSDDELRTAAVVLDRLRDAFYGMADSGQPEVDGPGVTAGA